MKSQLVIGALLGVALFAQASAQSVYRWTDANGRVQYSDQPPPPGAKDASERNITVSSIQNNEPSIAANDAQRRNPVVLFITECGESCDAARAFLNRRGIAHTVVDPTRSAELQKRFKDETGGNVLPVIKIGDKRLAGWQEGNWAAALDAAGYPKTAPFSKPKPVEDLRGVDSAKKEAAKDAPKEAAKDAAKDAAKEVAKK